MSAVRSSVTCDRVRAQVSLDLDDELSALERRQLQLHLTRCAACQAYAADLSSFTTALRAAPLEQLERAIVVRHVRRVDLARVHIGLAAVVAVALLGSVLQLALPLAESSSTSVRTPSQFPTLAQGRSEMRQAFADRRAFKQHRTGSAVVI